MKKNSLADLSLAKLSRALSNYRWLLLIYAILSLAVLWRLFLMKGSISGGDWGFPDNGAQVKVFFDALLHTWTRSGNIFGTRQLGSVAIIFIGPLLLLSKIGIGVPLVMKLFLLLIFSLAGANFNLFIRYIGVKPLPAFIGGLFFIFTPIFFNYSLMGWLYALLSLALMPLFIFLFLKAIDEQNFRLALLASVVFTLAIQSQTIIWYSLILVAIIFGYSLFKKRALISMAYGLLILICFLLLNSFWIVILLLFPDAGVSGSDLVKSTVSMGTSAHLSILNIARGWGSLFNYQYEYSYPKLLWLISFILPLMSVISFFSWRKYRYHLIYMVIIFLIPILLYSLDRNLIARLPFANLIRDFARFTVLSTFAIATLSTIALDRIFAIKKNYRKILVPLVLIILFANSYPFWSGALFATPKFVCDFRFRTKEWPPEYKEFDDILQKEDKSKRVADFPFGGQISISNDPKFRGPYQEVPDVYAGFAPVASMVAISDRDNGGSAELIDRMNNEALKKQDTGLLIDLASSAGINYLVYRKNLDMFDWGEVEKSSFERKLRTEVAKGNAEIYFDKGPILVITPKSVVPLISTFGQSAPNITYKEISPAKYEIQVSNIKDDFNLNFNENYNSYWRLVNSSGFFTKKISSDISHSPNNGFGNGYNVKISDLRASGVLEIDGAGNQNAKFFLLFWPERYLVLVNTLSIATAATIIFLIVYRRKKSAKNKNLE